MKANSKAELEAQAAFLKAELAKRDEQLRQSDVQLRQCDMQLRAALEQVRVAADGARSVENAAQQFRELYYFQMIRGIAESRPLDAELADLLRPVSAKPDDRTLLHVGFGHSATTSLQTIFFPSRSDLFYLGTPYESAGGFFSLLKYQDDYRFDANAMLQLCRDNIYEHPDRAGRPIVVSDELFADAGEVYYSGRLLPGDVVAARLKRYFPTAKILFTLRNQFEYVASMYFNLKRNYAFLAGMPMPPFEEWWAGMHTQIQCCHLGNLDYAPLIEVYIRLFGRDSVLILPLEELKANGSAAYLTKLCRFMEIPFEPEDVKRFGRPQNSRMTVVEERVAELLVARSAAPMVRQALENQALAGLIGQAPRAELPIVDRIAEEIRQRAAAGNRTIAEQFDLPLEAYGYPV